MPADIFGYIYAAAVAAGGIAGYLKAGSTTSLGAGLIFGGLAGLGAYRTSKDSKDVWLMIGVSASLGMMMGWRFYGSKKFMPAGMVALLSLGMFAKSVSGMLANETKKR